MSQLKGNKMTFDEYEHKLSTKPNKNTTNKNTKRPVVQSAKPVNQKTKIITTVRQEYSQKPFNTPNGRSMNITNTNQSQTTQGNQSNITVVNQTTFSTNPNLLDSSSQNSRSSPFTGHTNNHLKTHEVTRESIPPPVTHTSPAHKQSSKNQAEPVSNKSQQLNKIDLIFQKQPEDVQNKLRMLLLNYNAVMQYNQDQDKFQVDLLLPFNTPQEKDVFVQKFMKTRHYVSQQIEHDQFNHSLTSSQQMQINHYSSLHPNHQIHADKLNNRNQAKHQDNRNSDQFNSLNNRSNSNHPNSNQQSNNSHLTTKKSPNQSQLQPDNILSTSLTQQAQRIQEEKQLRQSDQKIDFFTLSQSLDFSIQKGLALIRHEKDLKNQKGPQVNELELSGQIDQIERENNKKDSKKMMKQEEQPQIQRTESHSRIQPQSHVDQFREPASQIESQISQGHKPNIPQSMERNLLHTPSGKNKPHQSAWMKPLQANESQSRLANSSLDYSQQEYSRMIKPTGKSLYESPIVPMKNQDSYDRNNTSNEILIQDLENYCDIQGYETPDKKYRENEDYQMEQQSYNSAFDMIEETAEEHQDQHFPSSLEYKEFLKKKIHDTSIRSGLRQKSQPKYSSSFLSREQSTSGHPRQGTSSLRAKYSQFLSKNHKKIESLYLRIGRQLRKKKQQQELEQTDNKRKQQGQILVADDQIEEINDKQENLLDGYKKRIVIQNDSMSSQDKVRYFRYLAKHAKGLYIDFIKNNHNKRNLK